MERGHLVRFRSSEATNGTRAHFLKTLFFSTAAVYRFALNGGGQDVRAPCFARFSK